MKKLLLIATFMVALSSQAQDFWTEYATAQPAASTGMRSISIVDDNVTWISPSCGTSGCTAIRRYAKTVNGGTVWTTGVVDLGANSANLEIANICATSADVAYASVFPKIAGAIGGVYKTINGGTTWTRQNTAVFNDPDSFTNIVHFFNANEGVTMGDPAGGSFEIYTTANGGTTWTRIAGLPAAIDEEEYGLTNKFTAKGNTVWIGTTFGRILKTTDKGATWTVVQSPILDFGGGINGDGTGDLAFTDQNNGILMTGDYILYTTTDGGTTWTENALWSGALRNFGISDIPGLAGTYICVGEDLDNSERGSSYSTDGGTTWVNINNAPDENFVQGGVVAFLNANTGFASGFSTSAAVGGIYKWNADHDPFLANTTFSNDKAFTATPNPTSGNLNIAGKNISNVAVYDILGKQVSNDNFSSLNNASINMSALNSGVYMVKVTSSTGASSTIKVVRN
jgi:photosystem II stability/assembly factor-like uncharacterized protein